MFHGSNVKFNMKDRKELNDLVTRNKQLRQGRITRITWINIECMKNLPLKLRTVHSNDS